VNEAIHGDHNPTVSFDVSVSVDMSSCAYLGHWWQYLRTEWPPLASGERPIDTFYCQRCLEYREVKK